jgi:hypothetical protein
MRTAVASLVLLCLAAVGGAPAAARPSLPTRFELRQLVLSDAIEDGLRDGRLSPARAADLAGEQEEIAARELQYRADGSLSDREVEVLEYLLDLASRRIDRALAAPSQVAAAK